MLAWLCAGRSLLCSEQSIPPYLKAETKSELKRSVAGRPSIGFCNEPLLGSKYVA